MFERRGKEEREHRCLIACGAVCLVVTSFAEGVAEPL